MRPRGGRVSRTWTPLGGLEADERASHSEQKVTAYSGEMVPEKCDIVGNTDETLPEASVNRRTIDVNTCDTDRPEVGVAKKLSRSKKHTVKAEVSNIDLTKAGSSISLAVYAAKEKIGTVEIGSGSLRWYGKYKQKPKPISWSHFADWMETF